MTDTQLTHFAALDPAGESDAEPVPFRAIKDVIEDWRCRQYRAKAQAKVLDKVTAHLRQTQYNIKYSLANLADWEAGHLAGTADELRAWVVATRKMFERRDQLLEQMLEQIHELYAALDNSYDEERQRSDMLDLLIQLAEEQQQKDC